MEPIEPPDASGELLEPLVLFKLKKVPGKNTKDLPDGLLHG